MFTAVSVGTFAFFLPGQVILIDFIEHSPTISLEIIIWCLVKPHPNFQNLLSLRTFDLSQEIITWQVLLNKQFWGNEVI